MNINKTFIVVVLMSTFASLSEAQVQYNWGATSVAKTLGADFISPDDVTFVHEKNFVYSDEQREELWKTIPSSRIDVGWLKRGRYILMPAPPEAMSLLQVRVGAKDPTEKETTTFGWLAIKKEPIPNSEGKPWREQTKMLSQNERTPNAAEIVWYLNTYYKARKVKLFAYKLVRSSSVDGNGNRIVVGLFTGDDPVVCGENNFVQDSTPIGIAAAGKRK